MKGITINRDTDGEIREVRYLTDDRDARDGRRLELCIGWGANGDWYVVTVPEGERSISAVRLCTSGGASSAVPGFVPLIAEAFRKLAAAGDPNTPFVRAGLATSVPDETVKGALAKLQKRYGDIVAKRLLHPTKENRNMDGERIRREMIHKHAKLLADGIANMVESVMPSPENFAYNIPREQMEMLLVGFADEIMRQIREPNPF